MCEGCEGAVVAGNDGDGGGEYEPLSTKGDEGAGAGAGAGLAGAGAGAGGKEGFR